MSTFLPTVSVPGPADVKVAVPDATTSTAAVQLLRSQSRVDEGLPDAVAEPALENVIVATVENRVVGAIVWQAAAGQVGWIWPPVVVRIEDAAVSSSQIGQRLVAAAAAKLAAAGCRLAQALLPPDDSRGKDLEASGFVFMTEMIRMERDCAVRLDRPRVTNGLEFVPYGQATEREFEQVIEQTYRESQDCPELDGVRTVTQALESYRAGGSFRPDLWLLARQRGSAVGCLLLAISADDGSCELQYMGVIPPARGRQLGRTLCERAVLEARRLGASKLFLSVDSRNRPAIKHYSTTGFTETERRRVYTLKLQPN